MLVLPYVFVLHENPGVIDALMAYGGESDLTGFSPQAFGAAMTVGIALFTQMGEQADYLRFMPARTPHNRRRWWLGVLLGGPGWIVPGIAKMFGGALLAFLALRNADISKSLFLGNGAGGHNQCGNFGGCNWVFYRWL